MHFSIKLAVFLISVAQINAVCLTTKAKSVVPPQCPVVQVQQEFDASKV